MERLTERNNDPIILCPLIKALEDDNAYCQSQNCDCDNCKLGKQLTKLAEYEDAEEQGLLIRLPVAEGSTVYVIDYILECKYDYDCKEIERCKCEDDIPCKHEYKKYRVTKAKFVYGMMAILGKTVFLTREEAEAALAEMER